MTGTLPPCFGVLPPGARSGRRCGRCHHRTVPELVETVLRRHPLADELFEGGVVHHDEDVLLQLTALRADLLLTAARAGRRVVLHSSADSRISDALAGALRDAGGVWVVEDDAGTVWDGLTGRVIDGVEVLLEPGEQELRVAPAFAAGVGADARHVLLAASVRHRRDVEPRLGALLEAFADGLGAPAVVYGPHEPAQRAWDRAEVAELLTRRPDAPRLLVAGSSDAPLDASLLVRPTEAGLEEVTEATLAVQDEPAGAVADRVRTAFERVATETFPLFAFVLVRPGRRDLSRPPALPYAPAPLAVLIGPPGVRDLGLDVDVLVDRFGAVRVGRPRVPGVLVPFSGELPAWDDVDRLVRLLGPDRVAAAFGGPVPMGRPGSG